MISMQWFLYMNGRNCWKGKGNQHILLNNKQLVYRHNKAILGKKDSFIEKVKIGILTTSFILASSGTPTPPLSKQRIKCTAAGKYYKVKETLS